VVRAQGAPQILYHRLQFLVIIVKEWGKRAYGPYLITSLGFGCEDRLPEFPYPKDKNMSAATSAIQRHIENVWNTCG
jgi:hypothetical protein